jgi:hypothetical protein
MFSILRWTGALAFPLGLGSVAQAQAQEVTLLVAIGGPYGPGTDADQCSCR